MQINPQNQSHDTQFTGIPDIDIEDLDAGVQDTGASTNEKAESTEFPADNDEGILEPNPTEGSDEENSDEESSDEESSDEENSGEEPPKKFRFNLHMGLLVAAALLIIIIIIRFFTWGERIDLSELFQDEEKRPVQNLDVWDNYIPLTNADGEVIPLNKSDGLNIVLFGNSPFSDDRDSEEGIASMLQEKLGGNVYNFSLSGSYLTAEQPNIDPKVQPWDALSLYWLALESTSLEVGDYFGEAINILGDKVPEGPEVHKALRELDFSTVDVIVIMYDATDYLLGRNLDINEGYPDIQVFAEVFSASLDILQSQHPNTRIIVMSPTYAFSDQLDENGDYISSDIYIYNEKPLSVYAITEYMKCYERGITFIDNIYGTITEDNAKDYLIDNLHLNQEGRKKVVDRLVHAITYFGVE